MKPDSMLVEPEHIATAGQQVVSQGADKALDGLDATEPALAAYIRHSLAAVAGRLALNGAPTEIVQATYEEALTTVLVSLEALRQGHYHLWKDALDGTPLGRLDQEAPRPPRRRRKKGGEPGGEGT